MEDERNREQGLHLGRNHNSRPNRNQIRFPSDSSLNSYHHRPLTTSEFIYEETLLEIEV